MGKLLASAMANAEHNHALDPDELYVSACFADEGPTLKRWRPRARGRATRIRKRTTHVTVIVSRLPESELRQRRAQRAQATTGRRGGPRRTPATSARPDRGGTGRGRRRDESAATSAGASTTGVDTTSFGGASAPGADEDTTPPAEADLELSTTDAEAPERTPEATDQEVPTTVAENDDTPNPDAVTERPEARAEGPAAGEAANEATEGDVSEDDDSSDDAEDKE